MSWVDYFLLMGSGPAVLLGIVSVMNARARRRYKPRHKGRRGVGVDIFTNPPPAGGEWLLGPGALWFPSEPLIADQYAREFVPAGTPERRFDWVPEHAYVKQLVSPREYQDLIPFDVGDFVNARELALSGRWLVQRDGSDFRATAAGVVIAILEPHSVIV